MNLCKAPDMNCVALAEPGSSFCTAHRIGGKHLHPKELTRTELHQFRRDPFAPAQVPAHPLGERSMIDLRKRFYLAGPMSGIADQNYPAFQSACDNLRFVGLEIVSPHETYHHPTEPDHEGWMDLLRRDAGSLLTCEGIILLPGWSQSKGARFELYLAYTLGMKIMLFKDGLLFDIS